MAIHMPHPGIIKYMIEEGLVPQESLSISIDFPTDGGVTVTYQVFMTGERLEKFQRAFAKYIEENGTEFNVMI